MPQLSLIERGCIGCTSGLTLPVSLPVCIGLPCRVSWEASFRAGRDTLPRVSGLQEASLGVACSARQLLLLLVNLVGLREDEVLMGSGVDSTHQLLARGALVQPRAGAESELIASRLSARGIPHPSDGAGGVPGTAELEYFR